MSDEKRNNMKKIVLLLTGRSGDRQVVLHTAALAAEIHATHI